MAGENFYADFGKSFFFWKKSTLEVVILNKIGRKNVPLNNVNDWRDFNLKFLKSLKFRFFDFLATCALILKDFKVWLRFLVRNANSLIEILSQSFWLTYQGLKAYIISFEYKIIKWNRFESRSTILKFTQRTSNIQLSWKINIEIEILIT